MDLLARLAWQLGPLQARAKLAPHAHVIENVAGCDVHWFVPARARGLVIVVPGLHPLGPTDPRLTLFCQRLASCGLAVACPGLTEQLSLRISPRSVSQLQQVIEAAWLSPHRPPGVAPGVMSISFGAYPALATRARGARTGGTLLFGGFFDFGKVIEFIIAGHGDPLNKPAACINAAGAIAAQEKLDPASLCDAWYRFCAETWGKPEMKEPAAYKAVAMRIAHAAKWSDHERELFLMGCNAIPDDGRIERAARLAGTHYPFLDEMRTGLASGDSPIAIAHGAGDDVIEVTHSTWLANAVAPSLRGGHFVTGLYGHTGTSSLSRLGAWPKEIRTMVGLLKAMARVATRPESLATSEAPRK